MFDDMVHVAFDLNELGYHIHATDSTHDFLTDKGVAATLVKFPGGEVGAGRQMAALLVPARTVVPQALRSDCNVPKLLCAKNHVSPRFGG